jgi:hypothetical protein
VVLHSHTGEEELLKERSIGVEVFGRDPDYDTAGDPVVRVRATEVRKRLAQYYQETGSSDDVRFEIPSGSYRAEFHWPGPKSDPELPAAIAPPKRNRWVLPAAGILIALVAAAIIFRPKPASAPLDVFWSPAIASPGPVLIYCGQPVVYFLSREVHEKYRPTVPPDKQRGSYPLVLDGSATLRGTDVIPVTDQFVGIGNAHTAAMLAALFARRDKKVEIRYANDLSFSDLRSSPSVLIGGFSNLWTLEMTGQLRFVFEQEAGLRRIRDRSAGKTYQLQNIAPDGKTPEDYAVVSRLFDSATGQPLVSAAGITQYGTRAAGELLTDPGRLAAALRSAPQGWEKKNVQILLHTTVYRGTPAPPRVLETHVW